MGLKSSQDQGIGMGGAGTSGSDMGLGSLLGLGGTKVSYADRRRSIICSVLDVDPMDSQLPNNDESLYDGVVCALSRKVADLSGSGTSSLSPYNPCRSGHSHSHSHSHSYSVRSPLPDHPSSGGVASAHAGRLGPVIVSVDRQSASGQIAYSPSGLLLESLSNFSSLRGSACVYAGKWQYEVVLHTAGIQQIGWATLYCPFTTEEGVGDAQDSYAYDGKRIRKWSVKCQPYGQPWAPGDVIGALIDLDAGEVSFMRNGVSMGVAYSNVRTMQPHLAYFPALSLSYTERAEINFGGRPFLFPARKYQSLQPPPAGGRTELGAYFSDCLKRLAMVSKASLGNTHGELERPCDLSAHCASEGIGREMEEVLGLPHKRMLMFDPSPQASSDLPMGSSATHREVADDGTQLQWEDSWLLGSVLGDQIGAMLMVPSEHTVRSPLPPAQSHGVEYFVHGQLLPALLSLHGTAAPHDESAACAAGRLLHMCLEGGCFEAVGGTLLEALASRCVSAALDPEDFPYSASYPFISLACCLVRRLPVFKSLWLRNTNFHAITEWLMSRKPPGPEDIKGLLPAVWWRGCRDETAAEERMKYALAAFSAAVVKVEDVQYELLTSLIGEPDPQDPTEDALIAFFRHLVQKNRGANRDIQPPGLSDPNVLVSVWFMLLRLLWGALGDLKEFPVGGLFVQAASKGDLEPVNDLSRLGGLLSFILRETPIAKDDLGPVSMEQLPSSSLRQPPCRDPVLKLLKPEWVVELLSMSMALYSQRVVTSVRQIQTMLQSLAASIAGLEEVERHMTHRGMSSNSSFAMTFGMHHATAAAHAAAAAAAEATSSAAAQPSAAGISASAVAAAHAAHASSSSGGGSSGSSSSSRGPGELFDGAIANALASALAEAHDSRSDAPQTPPSTMPGAASDTFTPTAVIPILQARQASPVSSESSSPSSSAPLPALDLASAASQSPSSSHSTPVPPFATPPAAAAATAHHFYSPSSYVPAHAAAVAAAVAASASASFPSTVTPLHPRVLGGNATSLPSYQHGYLQEARTFLRLDIASNGRCGLLLEATFYGGWKMDALVYQAAWVAHLLLQVAKNGPLLSYIPTCYAEMVIDSVTALRRSSDSAFKSPQPMQAQGLDDIIGFVVSALNDGRICSPDIKESLLSCISLLLESNDFVPLFEANKVACAQLVPSTICMFDSRLWHPVSSILLRLMRGSGFGHGAQEQSGCATKLRGTLQEQLRPGGHPGFGPFLNRLFNMLNWAVTDFAVCVADLHAVRAAAARTASSSRRQDNSEQQQQRKATVMFDLTVGLLRLLEFCALTSPIAFLAPGAMELTRLMEIIPFVLGHFTVGPDARRLAELLQLHQQPTSRMERNILGDKISRSSVLAPVMGLLLGLWHADKQMRVEEAGPHYPGEVWPTFLETLAGTLDPRMGTQQLAFLRSSVPWNISFPIASLPRDLMLVAYYSYRNGYSHQPLATSLADFGHLCEEVEVLRSHSHRLSSKDSSPATGAPSSSLAESEEEIPEAFVDPITQHVMRDPVVLPDSQVTLDRSTIARHLLTQAADPFSRKDLSIDMVKPDEELRDQIRAWQLSRQT